MSTRTNVEVCASGSLERARVAQPAPWVQAVADRPDEALMLQVRDGDRAAFREIVTRHIDRIVALARRVVGDAEAEEIAQDVFLKLWARKDQWSPGTGSFRTWLYRVALNRCIDATRKHRAVPLDDTIDPPDERAGPLETCETNETTRRLRRAMRELPVRQRIAIALYYSHDLTAPEVAVIMKLRVNAVESLLKRGRHRLRELLSR
ncbi:MAG: RNA polymerase sigma factor [Rhodospirillaceae bacterium]|nr:RNA polymerase sigma factor [Rhodospirillaceae bacterium]MCA8933512.1 RNA polymerase sigma factor [Rhodospirillaceae bacterium]